MVILLKIFRRKTNEQHEARAIRTPNLLIWSQTRYHCAIAPLHSIGIFQDNDCKILDILWWCLASTENYSWTSLPSFSKCCFVVQFRFQSTHPSTSPNHIPQRSKICVSIPCVSSGGFASNGGKRVAPRMENSQRVTDFFFHLDIFFGSSSAQESLLVVCWQPYSCILTSFSVAIPCCKL